MKIAQCLEYPLGLRGGVSVLVEVLAEQLAYNGHKIVLVSPDTRETLQRTGASKLIEEHIYWDPLKPSLANARKLAKQLSACGTDVAHFHAGGNYDGIVGCPIIALSIFCNTSVFRASLQVIWW